MKPITECDRRDAERLRRIHNTLQQLLVDVLVIPGVDPPAEVPDLTTIPEEGLLEIAQGIHRADDQLGVLFRWLDGDASAGVAAAIADALYAVVEMRELEARLSRIHRVANGHEVAIDPAREPDGLVWWSFCSCTDSNIGRSDSKAEAVRIAGAHAADHGGAWIPQGDLLHPNTWNDDGTKR